jgi:acetyltransferase-like isoleucine patch superfamily enzyme
MLGKMKGILKRLTLIKKFHRWLLSFYIGQRFVNFIFKWVFSQNRGCPWSVHYTSRISDSNRIKIGTRVDISLMFSGGCYIQGFNGIEIGNGTRFAPGVKIISANHDPYDYDKRLKEAPIIIGKNCWIGSNAVILPSVQLGDHVIVGAKIIKTLDKDKVVDERKSGL